MMNVGEGLNQKRARLLNRALVLNIMRRTGEISRADLARRSNLRQATITNITKELISLGYIRETGFLSGKGGRRSVGLEIDETRFRIIAARLTRFHFTVGLFTVMGTELTETRETVSAAGGPGTALDAMADVVNTMADEAGRSNVIGFGLAVPGPFSEPESHILLVTGFPGWDRVPLRQELERRIDLPLVLAHDANAAAVAEWWIGAGSPARFTSMVSFIGGQGIGAGIIINEGQVLRGQLGTAGEIGHHSINFDGPQCECGNRGCLELYCSTPAIIQRYQEARSRHGEPRGNAPGFVEIVRRYERGEDIAVDVVSETAEYVAQGLANVVNILNPDLVVLGDEIIALGDAFVQLVRERLRPLLVPEVFASVDVVKSAFGDDGTIRGMAMIVAEEALPMNTSE